MKNWWPSILIFICFSLAGFKVRQSNAINDTTIINFLSGADILNFKSDIDELDYLESIQLISNSVDLNAQLQLTKTNNSYNFHFTSIFNSEGHWNVLFEKSDDLIILKEVTGIGHYREIIHCK